MATAGVSRCYVAREAEPVRKVAKQLKLPLPRPSMAERKAFIRDRLDGYSFRQAAREAKRREAAKKRAERGTEAQPRPEPRQLDIAGNILELPPSTGAAEPLDQDGQPLDRDGQPLDRDEE